MNLNWLHFGILVLNVMEMFEISRKCPKYCSCQVALFCSEVPFAILRYSFHHEVPYVEWSTPNTTQGTLREPTGTILAPLFLSVYIYKNILRVDLYHIRPFQCQSLHWKQSGERPPDFQSLVTILWWTNRNASEMSPNRACGCGLLTVYWQLLLVGMSTCRS